MKLIDACSLGENCDQPRQHIEKQRHYFADKYVIGRTDAEAETPGLWSLDAKY